MFNDFKNKVVLITGGTSGIGLAAAEMFLQNQAKVALIGRNEQKGYQALEKLSEYKNDVLFIQGDIAKVADCQSVVQQTVQHLGRIDIVVNSAGQYIEKSILEVTEEEYDNIMGVNVKGSYFIAKFAVPEMRKAGQGAIVNISSDAGINGNCLCTTYCASKGAINTFTKALAIELANYNIRVNAVCPGDIHTSLLEEQLRQSHDAQAAIKEMASIYPMGRIGYPEEVAQVICFLCSENASFVTGALWTVDGGLTAC